MTLFYSATARGFFDDGLHKALPADAVPITAERHAQLMAAQSEGRLIKAGNGGAPVVIERPGLTPEQALAALRAERNRLLAESDYTQIPDAPLSKAKREEWRAYRQALRDLSMTVADPLTISWPDTPTL